MSLWHCPEHGLYGGQIACPKCGIIGEWAALESAFEPDPLPDELKAELAALEAMPDSEIDTSDIPEITDFSGFRRRRP